MLSIEQNYSDSFDIKFNINKNVIVEYNKPARTKCTVTFNNVNIESKAQGKQLRNLVGFDTNLNAAVSGVSVFQRILNKIMMIGKLNFEIIFKLESLCLWMSGI